MWKVPWVTVQMMIADMPWYDYDKAGSNGKNELDLDSLSKDDLKRFIDRVNNG